MVIVKQGHFVPVCYLNEFASYGKISVYDKSKLETRTNQSPKEIAKQRYFYDFSEDELVSLKELYPEIDKQFIEKFLSKNIEPCLKECLKTIHSYYLEDNDEYNYLLSKAFKKNISLQMAYQFLRTRGLREKISFVKKDRQSLVQKLLLLDGNAINNLADFFYSKKWIININKTQVPYYTSDNPVVVLDINSNVLSIDALKSAGIKLIQYPYSSSISLSLLDENLSEALNDLAIERLEVTNKYEVDYCNSLQIRNATMHVFFSGDQIEKSCLDLLNPLKEKYLEEKWAAELEKQLMSNFNMLRTGNIDNDELAKSIQILKKILKDI
ncbi:DUF4238 domain-containing protein [Paenibacillus tritici]|uniref:DUF4238 domain-containing protein n=1 Tax=Paenibacillus tritici TaxID=1873425 RepID=UPI001BAACA14|nr:DUF4238 domain-containing protein [Paenibacillus tritici]QUL57057.1 DUF4238 domain-containing protein [Paenibacillus tritici]